jgi:pyruvate ferredoxin oxidoreductase gamma subunit
MAAQALAVAATHDGFSAIGFPFFGAERRGAPVLAFTKFGNGRVRAGTQAYEPHLVVVLDETLLEVQDVVAGLWPEGSVIINSARPPERIALSRAVPTATVDATTIALDRMRRAVVNAPMLGAIARVSPQISLEGVERGIREIIGGRLGPDVADKNILAARDAYEAVTSGTSADGHVFGSGGRWLPDAADLPAGLAAEWTETPSGPIGPGSSVSNRTGSWRVDRPVLEVEKCTNCLLCWVYCPDGSIVRGEEAVTIEYDYCKGCGICAAVCAPKAIEMVREPLAEAG